MNQNNNRNYYTDIKKKMMKDFDKILEFTQQIPKQHFDEPYGKREVYKGDLLLC